MYETRTDQTRPPTMMDVARVAGVSAMTVSNVLSGRRPVRPETQARVQAAMAGLGFRPNAAARALRTTRSTLVGLVVPAIDDDAFVTMARELDGGLRAHGLHLVVAGTGWDPREELEVFDTLSSHGLDALVVSVTNDRSRTVARRLAALNCPLVLLDRVVPGLRCDHVLTDHRGGMTAAMTHLLDLGHERIGVIALPDRIRPGRELVAAYRDILAARKVTLPDELLVRPEQLTAADGRDAADHLLDAGVDAIVVATPMTFLAGVLTRLRERQCRIPDDVSVVAYDESELSRAKSPRLTVMPRPADEIGRLATDLIITRLADPSLPPRDAHAHLVLVPGESTAARR